MHTLYKYAAPTSSKQINLKLIQKMINKFY